MNTLAIPHLQEHVPLAPYTTFKIGGSARYFVIVKDRDTCVNAVAQARAAHIPWFMLGGGSDILVSDAGVNGLVIKTEMRNMDFDDAAGTVRAEAGVRLATLVTQAMQHELSGYEFSIGVPATVGGAVWANLGARGHETRELVRAVTVLDSDGAVRTLTPEECRFGYRDSIFKHEKFVILDALFQLRHEPKEQIKKRVDELSMIRKETQDITAKCAGCVFRNPTEQTDVPAAKLIDDLGLKGYTIGGAQVSDIHANFIINTGTATADDVVMLISYIKQQVRDKKGVQLMEEVEYIGFN